MSHRRKSFCFILSLHVLLSQSPHHGRESVARRKSSQLSVALTEKDKSAMLRKCLAGLSAEHWEIIDFSCTTTRNRSKRQPRSLAFRRTRSRRACSTRASGWRSCSTRRELKEAGHERDKRRAGASRDRSSAAVARGRDAEPRRR